MRAIYFAEIDLSLSKKIEVKDLDFHHLISVTRNGVGNEVLILNGLGKIASSKIIKIEKKKAVLEILKVSEQEKGDHPALMICLPKKEYFEECIKMAVEIGVSEVIPVLSDYSQRYQLNEKRIEKILKNSYEQSNNAYTLEIHEPVELRKSSLERFHKVWFFNSQAGVIGREKRLVENLANDLILIGPEGGFSANEMLWLRDKEGVEEVKLEGTKIMRTVTAVPYALGSLMH